MKWTKATFVANDTKIMDEPARGLKPMPSLTHSG
ncbi:hypothetical protein HNR39_000810 [Glaciimonas immobilis]|uniref:Uncharacterized protein n=1 Tax=Glaciimonas immobilis TaxID=728004 RepID=A0A840RQX5_9BURK|nr:hypothetical protein [Glaciimonas immobilis]